MTPDEDLQIAAQRRAENAALCQQLQTQHERITPTRSFAVVPAAGRSRRMGVDKLWLPWHGTTVVEAVLAAWRASPVTHLIVVTRRDQTRLIDFCRERGWAVVVLDFDPPEMKDSVAAGLQYIEEAWAPLPEEVWLLAPADMPQLSPAVINELLTTHRPEAPAILVPTCSARRGHPVLFPWPTAAAVSQLGPNEGINVLLHRQGVREIPWDDISILKDLDTPTDYENLRGG